MDKIYSRKKFKIPFIYKINKNRILNKRKKKFIKVLIIIVIAILTSYTIVKEITPVIDKNCSNIAKTIATKVSNEQATLVMSKYKYDDLCNITKDSNGNIAMVSSNVISINEIISDITIKIQDELNKKSNSNFKIKLGSLTGTKIFSGRGPEIEVKISTIGNLDTNLKSELISNGINQTLHRIYLEIKCNVAILTPFDTSEETITNQILLAEAVIVGTTPETYYNFNGENTKDMALEIM